MLYRNANGTYGPIFYSEQIAMHGYVDYTLLISIWAAKGKESKIKSAEKHERWVLRDKCRVLLALF